MHNSYLILYSVFEGLFWAQNPATLLHPSKFCQKAVAEAEAKVEFLRIFYACWGWRHNIEANRQRRRRLGWTASSCYSYSVSISICQSDSDSGDVCASNWEYPAPTSCSWMRCGCGCPLPSLKRPGTSPRRLLLGFRVLFSLHSSCITSMAIVYVNFDVSAKVLKCEVLDVLIALPDFFPRQPQTESDSVDSLRTTTLPHLDRWRMPKAGEETTTFWSATVAGPLENQLKPLGGKSTWQEFSATESDSESESELELGLELWPENRGWRMADGPAYLGSLFILVGRHTHSTTQHSTAHTHFLWIFCSNWVRSVCGEVAVFLQQLLRPDLPDGFNWIFIPAAPRTPPGPL